MRRWALGPMTSLSRRLPLIAVLSTPTSAVRRCACSRRARTSGQRALASVVDAKPSVIESPNVTTARAPRSAMTSTPLSQYQLVIVDAIAMSAALVKSPAGDTYEVWCASVSWVVPTWGAGTYRLIARSSNASTSSATGSVSATPPGATEIEAAPAKVRGRSDRGRTDAPDARTPMLAAPITSGAVPCALENRTRTARPARLTCTIWRSVT